MCVRWHILHISSHLVYRSENERNAVLKVRLARMREQWAGDASHILRMNQRADVLAPGQRRIAWVTQNGKAVKETQSLQTSELR